MTAIFGVGVEGMRAGKETSKAMAGTSLDTETD